MSSQDMRGKDYSSIFHELWTKFTQHYDDFMHDRKEGLNDIFETAKNNYEYLKQKGYEGVENVGEQLKEKNNQLVEKLHQTNTAAQETIREKYQQLSDSMHDASQDAGKHLESLKVSFKDALNKVGDNTSDAYHHSMTKIDQFEGQTKEEYDKFYHEMSHNLETVYNESIVKIKYYFSFDGDDGHTIPEKHIERPFDNKAEGAAHVEKNAEKGESTAKAN